MLTFTPFYAPQRTVRRQHPHWSPLLCPADLAPHHRHTRLVVHLRRQGTAELAVALLGSQCEREPWAMQGASLWLRQPAALSVLALYPPILSKIFKYTPNSMLSMAYFQASKAAATSQAGRQLLSHSEND